MLFVVLRNETGLSPLFLVVGYVKLRKFRCQGLCALFSVKAGPHTISTIDEKKFTDCYGYDMETTLAAIDAEIGSLP